MMNKKTIAVLMIITATLLSGCSSKAKFKSQKERYEDSVIPTSSRTMKQIYEDRGTDNTASQGKGMPDKYAGYMVNKRRITDAEASISPYTTNIYTTAQFKHLPNPTIYVYILPSLTSQDRMPRPGWWTEFKMYDRDEYALPGEVSLTEGY